MRIKIKHTGNRSGFIVCCLLALSACKQVPPPAPVLPVPSENQIEWQKMETYAFVHFGLNTFNDLEWGYGNTPASTFNPDSLDCEQWVRIIKAAGLKGVMLTAKHHDGFCLWPSQYTEYSVKNSPFRNGKGDLVKELSEACKKHGLKFGIYLSPWDRNHAGYGKPEYTEYFHNQIKELLSNYGELFEYWFDGANGGDGWYGGANEKRSIDPKSYYRYEDARKIIRELQPKAVIFGGTCADIRWIGNEEGWAGETNWSTFDETADPTRNQMIHGIPNGDKWLAGECDVSIRPGWFYHPREDHQVHSLSHLVDLYYKSVGRNANFLLNFPVALNGKIHPADSARIMEWRKTIDAELKENLLKKATATTDHYRGNSALFAASRTNDGNWDTYWATDDGVTTASLTFTLPAKQGINRLLLQEYIPLGQRVSKFNIEYNRDGQWLPVETSDTMTTVGYKRIIRFRTVEADKIRINFTEARGSLCINNIEAFLAPALMTEPEISRTGDNTVTLKAGDKGTDIHYTTDGSEPALSSTKYDKPFEFAKKGVVKAISYDAAFKKQSPCATKIFDIPRNAFRVANLNAWTGKDEQRTEELTRKSRLMFDGDNRSTFYFPLSASKEVCIDLGAEYEIGGFTYTPDQSRWGSGVITHYQLFIGKKEVAAGEFSNIRNNPVEQVVRFDPAWGRQARFVVTATADPGQQAGIAEFSVITVEAQFETCR